MSINRLTSTITNIAGEASKKVGRAILNNKPEGAKLANGLRKFNNNFLQGEAYNPGRGAYYTLISAFVLIPRLLQVREPDEFREVLTRDVTTVLTILFAMKGLKSGMCAKAQRDSGLVLVKDTVGKDANKFKRFLGYLSPEGGISAMSSQEILARYSGIKNKETLINAMNAIDKDGGNLGKVFSIENRPEGVLSRAKRFFSNKPDEGTPLYDAAKKMFGEGFEQKSNQELIDAVKAITSDSKDALQGLKEMVGSNPLEPRTRDIAENAEQSIGGILNSDKNPLTYYARNVASNFETISLAITAGFLGFGLPKLNEVMTKKRHLNKPGTNINRASEPPVMNKQQNQIYSSIKNSNIQSTFHAFM